jgi:hypothetical protein
MVQIHLKNERERERERMSQVAYVSNPSYLGGRDQGIAISGQPRQKVNKTPFQPRS